MQEIEIQFRESIRGVQIMDPKQAASFAEPNNDSAARRESLRPGGPAAQLDTLKSELDDLRSQLERRRQAPDPAATAAVLQRENELKVEVERTRATRQALEALMKNMGQLVNQLRQEPERLKLELQEAAIHLGELIASKLLNEKIDTDQFNIKAMVQELVQKLDTKEPIALVLNPQDLTLLRNQLGEELLLEVGHEYTLTGDASLPRGSCKA